MSQAISPPNRARSGNNQDDEAEDGGTMTGAMFDAVADGLEVTVTVIGEAVAKGWLVLAAVADVAIELDTCSASSGDMTRSRTYIRPLLVLWTPV